MHERLNEPDWKIFKGVRQTALQRFSEQILAEIARLSAQSDKSQHERFVAVLHFTFGREREMASTFNDFRRSSAVRMLASMQALNVLTEEELNWFSPETRNSVVNIAEIYRM